MLQVVLAVAGSATAYAISGPARGAVFPAVMVILMFGMFALEPRKLLAVGLYAVSLFGTVMWAMSSWKPDIYVPAVEWGHFTMLATMMPMVSLLAGQLARLRSRLELQRGELADALAQIQILATRDSLTGLVNRRQISELIEREIGRVLRKDTRFCIAMIDLDHFKRVNDNHGHGAGDLVLCAFARESSQLVRETDALSRWGGEEFLLLMPDTILPHAQGLVERLRRATERAAVTTGSAELQVTFSAGVVQHRPGETAAQMTERADEALYSAKARGRNQVVAD